MSNAVTLRLFWGICLFLTIVVSCKKKDSSPDGPATTREVNEWVVDRMRDVYYWNTHIPRNSSLNFNLQPLNFFDRLLHPEDRFSVMQKVDELEDGLAGISTTVGLGIGLIRLSSRSDQVVISVRYVLKNSPAAEAGIQRGDFITKINGREMTLGNYNQVLAPYFGSAPFVVSMARLELDQLVPGSDLQLRPVAGFQENAIHYDTVLVTPSGTKVAYLFYNKFLNHQVDDLLAVFARFRQAGVQDLVLDLRYNGGGGIYVAGVLSALIHRDFDENAVFVQYKYNDNYRDFTETYAETFGSTSEKAADRQRAAELIAAIKTHNLRLPRVFVLATASSASASELIINNLRPFISDANVIHIGDTTVGKNEGSITIKDERNPPRIDWGLQPIVVKIANATGFGDYPRGLPPQVLLDEWGYLPWKPIGSLDDPLLSRALELIDPALQALRSKSARQPLERTRGLQAIPIGIHDRHNPIVPIQLEKWRPGTMK